jgi:5'-3' exonuclease
MDGRFMEHLYLFLSILRYYCIRPVIIFDGKAPAEKRATIQKRQKDKQEANQQFGLLQKQLDETNDDTLRQDLTQQMAALKKRMVRITWEHIDTAIELIQAFGFEYYLAPHEADQLCIHLATTGNVYAILSDDMDLIVSGAPRVLRIFNMTSRDVILYDTQSILLDLNMTLQDFRETVVLSGTDYELKTVHPIFTIKKCFELYHEYRASSFVGRFHTWLSEKGIVEKNEFQHICSLFDSDSAFDELTEFLEKKRPVTKLRMNVANIQKIMRQHKFIFVPSL